MIEVVQIPVLSDNYVYLLHEPDSGMTAAIDPPVPEPVLSALEDRDWRLTHIFNTHHHWDHTGANEVLKSQTGCEIIGFHGDVRRIPGIDRSVSEGMSVALGASKGQVLEVPGHTLGHIAYWFEDSDAVFCGDTLFALGCGRLFEGSARQMWNSLCKLRDLPESTKVYCAHEYTLTNARFALTVEPDYPPLLERAKQVETLRRDGQPTVPSTIGEERLTNPFLRADDPGLQARLGMKGEPAVAVFAEIRRRKDHFRG